MQLCVYWMDLSRLSLLSLSQTAADTLAGPLLIVGAWSIRTSAYILYNEHDEATVLPHSYAIEGVDVCEVRSRADVLDVPTSILAEFNPPKIPQRRQREPHAAQSNSQSTSDP